MTDPTTGAAGRRHIASIRRIQWAIVGHLVANGTTTVNDVRAAVGSLPSADQGTWGHAVQGLAKAGIIRRVQRSRTVKSDRRGDVIVWKLAIRRDEARRWLKLDPNARPELAAPSDQPPPKRKTERRRRRPAASY